MDRGGANGEEMQVDSVEVLPDDLAEKVDETHQSYACTLLLTIGVATDLSRTLDYPREERSDRHQKAGQPRLKSHPLRSNHRVTYRYRILHHLLCRANTQRLVDQRAKLLSTHSKQRSLRDSFRLKSRLRIHFGPGPRLYFRQTRARSKFTKTVPKPRAYRNMLARLRA